MFYSKEDFVGRSFKIKEIYFNQVVRGEFVEKQCFLDKYYLKLTDVIDVQEGIFEGQIYSKSYKGDFFFTISILLKLKYVVMLLMVRWIFI